MAEDEMRPSEAARSADAAVVERFYRVRGPFLLKPGEAPPDSLEVALGSSSRITICGRSHEGFAHDPRVEALLSRMGANALLDADFRSDENSVEGALGIIARRNRLGGESAETFLNAFQPRVGTYDLADVRVHHVPQDVGRILKSVLAGIAGFFLLLLLAFVVLVLAAAAAL